MQTEFPERYITLGLKIAILQKKRRGLTQEILAERIGKKCQFYWPGRRDRNDSGCFTGKPCSKSPKCSKIQPSKLLEDD